MATGILGSCLTAEQRDALDNIGVSVEEEVECEGDGNLIVSENPEYEYDVSYSQGDRVTILAEDGKRLVVYQAINNISSPSGYFKPNLWTRVCEKCVSERVGVKSYEEMVGLYTFYNPSVSYPANSLVLLNTECGNYTCLYISKSTSGTTPPPTPSVWQKVYCVGNGGEDGCRKQFVCEEPNRRIISLSSPDSDLICIPVES